MGYLGHSCPQESSQLDPTPSRYSRSSDLTTRCRELRTAKPLDWLQPTVTPPWALPAWGLQRAVASSAEALFGPH